MAFQSLKKQGYTKEQKRAMTGQERRAARGSTKAMTNQLQLQAFQETARLKEPLSQAEVEQQADPEAARAGAVFQSGMGEAAGRLMGGGREGRAQELLRGVGGQVKEAVLGAGVSARELLEKIRQSKLMMAMDRIQRESEFRRSNSTARLNAIMEGVGAAASAAGAAA